MRAATYTRTGPAAEVIEVRAMDTPDPAPNEVLVRVAASGINPADVKRRAGWGGMQIGHPLVIPHCDGSGTIEAVGDGVDHARIGQRVYLWKAQGGYGSIGRAFGTAAEYISISQELAVPLPDHFTFEQGACLGVPAMTAHRCVLADGPVSGSTVLVQGGAGAVGYLAVQIALLEGARVLATVGNAAAVARLDALSAEPVLRHDQDVVAKVLELTAGDVVDRIIEVDFAANQSRDVSLLKTNGTIASYSSSSEPSPILDYYAIASKGGNIRFIQGFALPDAATKQAQRWLASHALDIPIAATFPLAKCADGHIHVETSKAFGQTIILP